MERDWRGERRVVSRKTKIREAEVKLGERWKVGEMKRGERRRVRRKENGERKRKVPPRFELGLQDSES